MSHSKIELFGHIVYSEELSYDELMAREEQAKVTVQQILEQMGGEFIHFESVGDVLRFQCVMPEESDNTFHDICDALARHAVNGLDCRLLFVDKDLSSVYFYSISRGKWQEGTLTLPPPGYLARSAVSVVRNPRNAAPVRAVKESGA